MYGLSKKSVTRSRRTSSPPRPGASRSAKVNPSCALLPARRPLVSRRNALPTILPPRRAYRIFLLESKADSRHSRYCPSI